MPEPRPVIGDFRQTTASDLPRKETSAAPVDEAPAVKVPAEPDTRSAETVMQKTIAEMKAAEAVEAALTPTERYQNRLRAAGISNAEATTVYDGVLAKGYYEEYVRLGKAGRATFRTRFYEDSLRLQTALEIQKPQLVLTQDDLVTRYNMAASLYEWQGKAIPHENEDDFDKALRVIRRLPGPVFALLAGELSKFDLKVMTVFSDGAAANFS